MIRAMVVVLIAMTVTGCGIFSRDDRIVTKPVEVPVLQCPSELTALTVPPDRPNLLIYQLEQVDLMSLSDTERTEMYKRVVNAYMASILQLHKHIDKLESSVISISTVCNRTREEHAK